MNFFTKLGLYERAPRGISPEACASIRSEDFVRNPVSGIVLRLMMMLIMIII